MRFLALCLVCLILAFPLVAQEDIMSLPHRARLHLLATVMVGSGRFMSWMPMGRTFVS
jgi:hypothetical protein